MTHYQFNKLLVLTFFAVSQLAIGQSKDSINDTSLNSKSKFKKGSYYVGGNAFFSGKESENDFLVLNIDIPEAESDRLGLSLTGGYFINPTTAVGARFAYSYTKKEQTLIANFLGIAFNAEEYTTMSISKGILGAVYMRNYIPMGSSGSFYFLNETSFDVGYEESMSRAITNPGKNDETIRKVKTKSMLYALGFSPGITYFSKKQFAFEFQLGTTGLEVVKENFLMDGETEGTSRNVNFRNSLSFLRVKVGFTYYFGSTWNK